MAFQGTSGDLILVSNCVPYAGLTPHISSLMSTETFGSLFMHLKIHRKKTMCTHSIQHPACANCYLYNLSVKRKNSLKFIMSLKALGLLSFLGNLLNTVLSVWIICQELC